MSDTINMLKCGSGYCVQEFDSDKKYISINFEGTPIQTDPILGDLKNQCFRNDASILFFASNSYRSAYQLLEKEISGLFERVKTEKSISHLIMPYYFNFRHFVELELKALIASFTGEKPSITHQLGDLMRSYLKCFEQFRTGDLDESQLHHYEELKKLNTELDDRVRRYISHECNHSYYRYLFESNFTLNHPVLSLDFSKMCKLFRMICECFDSIRCEAQYLIYLQYMF